MQRALLALLLAAGPAAESQLAEIRVFGVAIRDDVAFLGRTGGLDVLDISDPQKTVALGELRLPASVRGVTLEGSTALLAAGAHGVYVVDVTETAAPSVLGQFDTPGRVRDAVRHGDHALLADGRNGLTVVDLRDPARPIQRANVPTRGDLRGLALSGDRLATAEGLAGVRLFDISRPDVPREVALLRDAEGARDVLIAYPWLAVAAGRRGLLLYALDDGRPALRAELELDGAAEFLSESAGKILVSCGTAGIEIVDPSAAVGRRRLGRVRLPGAIPAGRTATSGGRTILAADRWGHAIADLTDPSAPQVLYPRSKRLKVSFP